MGFELSDQRVGESPLFCWSRQFRQACGRKQRQRSRKSRSGWRNPRASKWSRSKSRAAATASFLRISIDKPEGVTHADCELVSATGRDDSGRRGRGAGPLHAGGQFARSRAKLFKPQDYERFQGKRRRSCCASRSKTSALGKGRWRVSPTASISLEPEPGKSVQFPLDQVQKANLKFEW